MVSAMTRSYYSTTDTSASQINFFFCKKKDTESYIEHNTSIEVLKATAITIFSTTVSSRATEICT